MSSPLPEGPPCLNTIFSEGGVENQDRWETLLNTAIYHHKVGLGAADILDRLNERNRQFELPVPFMELCSIVEQAVLWGHDSYRCTQSPLAKNCRRDLCRTRKWGIGQGPVGLHLGNLVKYTADDVTWIWRINRTDVRLTTAEIINQKRFLDKINKELGITTVPCSSIEWMNICMHALANATHVVNQIPGRAKNLVTFMGELDTVSTETSPLP
jgi:hypothetical protein